MCLLSLPIEKDNYILVEKNCYFENKQSSDSYFETVCICQLIK